MRLQQVTSGSTARLTYDGLDRIAEYDAAGALLRRYVFGPDMDQPIVWYEGSAGSDRQFLSGDAPARAGGGSISPAPTARARPDLWRRVRGRGG